MTLPSSPIAIYTSSNTLFTIPRSTSRGAWANYSSLIVVAIHASHFLLLLSEIIFEIRVVAGLLGRYTPGRVVYQHHFEELKTLLVEVRAEGLPVVPLPLGE